MQTATKQIEQKQALEADYRNRIEQIMSRFVGFDKVRSEVDIVLDFTQIETTYEDFDKGGTGGITRSEILNVDEQETMNGEEGAAAGTFVQAPEQTDPFRARIQSRPVVQQPRIMNWIAKYDMSKTRWG